MGGVKYSDDLFVSWCFHYKILHGECRWNSGICFVLSHDVLCFSEANCFLCSHFLPSPHFLPNSMRGSSGKLRGRGKASSAWSLSQVWSSNCCRWRKAPCTVLCSHGCAGDASWLFARQKGGEVLGLGCKACWLLARQESSAQSKSCLASNAGWNTQWHCRRARFRSRSEGLEHKRAVAALGICEECAQIAADASDRSAAPAASDFESVWGARTREETRAHVSRSKRAQLEFCIAEAMRMMDRDHMWSSPTLVTHVDGKGKLLSMRVSATSSELLTCKFFLGHVEHVSQADRVEAYVDSVLKLLRAFCIEFNDAPGTLQIICSLNLSYD